MHTILQRLVAEPVSPVETDRIEDWWAAHRAVNCDWDHSADLALAGGVLADRVGFAFVAGYEAALRRMVPTLPEGGIHAFSATEEGGAHPRAIHTTLEKAAGGGWTLSGRKRWTTGGSLADRLLVVASTGTDENGRNRLRVVEVPVAANGVRIVEMPPTEFTPEIPHSAVEFEAVALDEDAPLDGDGYEDYLKPFRTIEDLHVNAAVLAYLLGVARRHDWPHDWSERTLATIVALRALTTEDPKAPEVHVAVAGALGASADTIRASEEHWASVSGPERERWERDRKLLEVAGRARSARRDAAWQRLAE